MRLFAPFLPFATEETWSWTHTGSIHRSPWPTADELTTTGDADLLADIAVALIAIRGAKSTAKVSMKAEVAKATFAGPAAVLGRLRAVETDLRSVGKITGDVEWVESDSPLTVAVELAASA